MSQSAASEYIFFIKVSQSAASEYIFFIKVSQSVDHKTSREKSVPKCSMSINGYTRE